MTFCRWPLVDIDAVLHATPLIADLREQTASASAKLDEMHQRLEEEVTANKEALQSMISALKRTEKAIETRVKSLEGRCVPLLLARVARCGTTHCMCTAHCMCRVNARVNKLVADHGAGASSWLVPFLLLAGVIVAGAIYAYREHTKFVKNHIL